MELVLIASVARNLAIGDGGHLPWRIKEDLKHFRKLTLHHPVIMGKSTFGSIIGMNGKPLDRRYNIIMSSKPSIEPNSGGIIYHAFNLEEALKIASGFGEIAYVIGGQKVYEQTISHPLTRKLEITEINQDYPGDAFFPEYRTGEWKEEKREKHELFDFVTYIRNI